VKSTDYDGTPALLATRVRNSNVLIRVERSKGNPMRTNAKVWLTLALLVAAAPMLSACHTTRGAGEDLSAAGHGLERAADKNTHY